MNIDTFFSCYLMSVITLNIFVLRKHPLIFELCHYFIIFITNSGAVAVKTGRIQCMTRYLWGIN